MKSKAYKFLEENIEHLDISSIKKYNSMEYCLCMDMDCTYCEIYLACGKLFGTNPPTLTKKELNLFKENHVEYFL